MCVCGCESVRYFKSSVIVTLNCIKFYCFLFQWLETGGGAAGVVVVEAPLIWFAVSWEGGSFNQVHMCVMFGWLTVVVLFIFVGSPLALAHGHTPGPSFCFVLLKYE